MDRKTDDKRIMLIVGIFLQGFMLFLLLITTFLFLFNISISWIHSMLAICSSALLCFWFSGDSKKVCLSVGVGLLIIVICCLINSFAYDFSWDGNAYHKSMTAFLRYGWNPLRETFYNFADSNFPLLSAHRSNYLDAYPKGSEMIAACLYAVSNNIEIGKSFNLLSIVTVFCIGRELLIETAGLRKWKAGVCAFLFAVHPVSLGQVFTYYNDGFLWQMIFLCTLSGIYLTFFENGRYARECYFLIFSTISIGFNVKFSGVIFFALSCGGLFVFWVIRKIRQGWGAEGKRVITYRFILFAVSVLNGFLFAGATSYVINVIRHKNPFYSIWGEGSNEIIDSMMPAPYKDLSNGGRFWRSVFSKVGYTALRENYKIPFLFDGAEVSAIQSYDQIVGGWGILFSGLLILGLLVLALVLVHNRKKEPLLCELIILFLFLGIAAILVVPGLSWARYFAAPIYVPVSGIVLLFCTEFGENSYRSIFVTGVITALCLVNIVPNFMQNQNILNEYQDSKYDLQKMKIISESAPLKVSFYYPPHDYTYWGRLFTLMDNNISNYTYSADVTPDMTLEVFPSDKIFYGVSSGIWAAQDLETYIEELRNLRDIAVFISVKDEASRGLTDSMIMAMQSLGLQFDMRNQFQESYIAVIDNENVVYETNSDELINYEYIIGHKRVALSSAGYLCGNVASIQIEGKEYALNKRGLNIAVYDKKNKIVLDSVSFDTYETGACVHG